eukprot:2597717-Rhodomonas_salina.1
MVCLASLALRCVHGVGSASVCVVLVVRTLTSMVHACALCCLRAVLAFQFSSTPRRMHGACCWRVPRCPTSGYSSHASDMLRAVHVSHVPHDGSTRDRA